MNLFLGILGPDKIGLAFTCGQFKPEPSLDNTSDELRVVSRSNKNFVGFFGVSVGVSWERQININWVGEVDFVQELNESGDFFLINGVWSNIWHSKNHFIRFFLEKSWNIASLSWVEIGIGGVILSILIHNSPDIGQWSWSELFFETVCTNWLILFLNFRRLIVISTRICVNLFDFLYVIE